MKVPNVPASVPSKVNIIVNPSTNPKEFTRALYLLLSSFSFPPTKYDTYKGKSGKIQGEIKLILEDLFLQLI